MYVFSTAKVGLFWKKLYFSYQSPCQAPLLTLQYKLRSKLRYFFKNLKCTLSSIGGFHCSIEHFVAFAWDIFKGLSASSAPGSYIADEPWRCPGAKCLMQQSMTRLDPRSQDYLKSSLLFITTKHSIGYAHIGSRWNFQLFLLLPL